MKKIDISTPRYPNTFALVDDDDYAELSRYKWYRESTGYVKRSVRTGKTKRNISMHKAIMGDKLGFIVDHKNNNKLDNQRHNLRFATPGQNNMNCRPKTGRPFKGVYLNTKVNKYEARIRHKGTSYYLGIYHTDVEAAIAYDACAVYLFGEFACLNRLAD